MDKITVVCHKDHVVGYEDYRDQCLLCVVEDLMREVGRLTAVCKEKEWVGLTDVEGAEIWSDAHDIDGNRIVRPKEIVQRISDKLKEKNT